MQTRISLQSSPINEKAALKRMKGKITVQPDLTKENDIKRWAENNKNEEKISEAMSENKRTKIGEGFLRNKTNARQRAQKEMFTERREKAGKRDHSGEKANQEQTKVTKMVYEYILGIYETCCAQCLRWEQIR